MLYNWQEAPEWANYAARDSNGFAHWFSELPVPFFESGYGIEWNYKLNSLTSSDIDPFWNQNDCPEAVFSLEARNGENPYLKYIGKELIVERRNDSVLVSIFRNKIDNTYSFINLTKKHICTCKFDSVELALADLQEQTTANKVVVATFKKEN